MTQVRGRSRHRSASSSGHDRKHSASPSRSDGGSAENGKVKANRHSRSRSRSRGRGTQRVRSVSPLVAGKRGSSRSPAASPKRQRRRSLSPSRTPPRNNGALRNGQPAHPAHVTHTQRREFRSRSRSRERRPLQGSPAGPRDRSRERGPSAPPPARHRSQSPARRRATSRSPAAQRRWISRSPSKPTAADTKRPRSRSRSQDRNHRQAKERSRGRSLDPNQAKQTGRIKSRSPVGRSARSRSTSRGNSRWPPTNWRSRSPVKQRQQGSDELSMDKLHVSERVIKLFKDAVKRAWSRKVNVPFDINVINDNMKALDRTWHYRQAGVNTFKQLATWFAIRGDIEIQHRHDTVLLSSAKCVDGSDQSSPRHSGPLRRHVSRSPGPSQKSKTPPPRRWKSRSRSPVKRARQVFPFRRHPTNRLNVANIEDDRWEMPADKEDIEQDRWDMSE